MLSKNQDTKDDGVKDSGRRLFLKKTAASLSAISLTALLGRLIPLIQSYSPTPLTEGPAQKKESYGVLILLVLMMIPVGGSSLLQAILGFFVRFFRGILGF